MKTSKTEDLILRLLSQAPRRLTVRSHDPKKRKYSNGLTAGQLAGRVDRTDATTRTALNMLKAKALVAFSRGGWVITTKGLRYRGDL